MMRRARNCLPRCTSILCAAASLAVFAPNASRASQLQLEAFLDLAQRCGSTVAASTLAAVAKTESGFETLAISDNTTGRARSYLTVETAASTAERLIARGHSLDLGLMQINSANLKSLAMTIRDALDPCKSISAAASILTSNYLGVRNASSDQSALRDAISQYNTGNRTDGYRNGYVRKVEQAARALVPGLVSEVARDSARGEGSDQSDGGAQTSQSWDVWNSAGAEIPQDASIAESNSIDVF